MSNKSSSNSSSHRPVLHKLGVISHTKPQIYKYPSHKYSSPRYYSGGWGHRNPYYSYDYSPYFFSLVPSYFQLTSPSVLTLDEENTPQNFDFTPFIYLFFGLLIVILIVAILLRR